ncbi:hypothetical protein DFQ11_1414 [Winogradskyella epiphytica]|uniref:Uncharacterized protein n=1 Tax=Winogradskyella epiphytica TaxID=262005 RepID=A0A2V4XF69_9FLAO|nr:DUF6095 family protein [Winogradskyella epiphytica]PYE78211.1 hypothetical protein DFQ11_1414 [Winogradskyella epiphytica]GGW76044.1 hypothetical protein GCM10008085_29530 [Winogradskyella epiphytica]
MDDNNNRTDKELLTKGLKRLGGCLLLMFLGPTILHLTLNHDDKPLYIPLLILAFILCIGAIVLLFLGINTIMDSIFKKKK